MYHVSHVIACQGLGIFENIYVYGHWEIISLNLHWRLSIVVIYNSPVYYWEMTVNPVNALMIHLTRIYIFSAHRRTFWGMVSWNLRRCLWATQCFDHRSSQIYMICQKEVICLISVALMYPNFYQDFLSRVYIDWGMGYGYMTDRTKRWLHIL